MTNSNNTPSPDDNSFSCSDCWGWHTHQCDDCNRDSGCNQSSGGERDNFVPVRQCNVCGTSFPAVETCECEDSNF